MKRNYKLAGGAILELIASIVLLVSVFMPWIKVSFSGAELLGALFKSSEFVASKTVSLFTFVVGTDGSESNIILLLLIVIPCIINIILKCFMRARWMSVILILLASFDMFALIDASNMSQGGISFDLQYGFFIAMMSLVALLVGVLLPHTEPGQAIVAGSEDLQATTPLDSGQQTPVYTDRTPQDSVAGKDNLNKLYYIGGAIVALLIILLAVLLWPDKQKQDTEALETKNNVEVVDEAADVAEEVTESEESPAPVEQTETSRSVTLYGSVHTYPITMNLYIKGSVVKGTYYYNKQGPDNVLTLSGVFDDGEMDIYETDEKGRQTGHFKGYYINGEYQGEFVTMQGKSMKFRVSE